MRSGTVYRQGDGRVQAQGTPGVGRWRQVQDVRLSGCPLITVTIHDVAPATQSRCERLIEQIESVAPLALTLLVVPRYHNQPSTAVFERWIDARVRRGDELALHGLTHLDDSLPPTAWIDRLRRNWYTAREGEFAALDEQAARERIAAGLNWFAERRWPVCGFVAPAWLLGAGAWNALHQQPFNYTCTLMRLFSLQGPRLRATNGWSVVFSTRARWRRDLSLAWNTALAWYQQNAQWMRLELHPADVQSQAVRNVIGRLLDSAHHGGREPLTLGAVAKRLAAEVN